MKLKKLLCGLLAIVILLSMLSAFAYADEVEEEISDAETTGESSDEVSDENSEDTKEESDEQPGLSYVNIPEENMTGDGTKGNIADLKSFECVMSNDTLEFYVNHINGFVALRNKKTNAIWHSNPVDWEKDSIAKNTNREQLQSQLVVTYLNSSYEVLTIPSTEAHIVSEHIGKEEFIFTYVFSGATRNFSIPISYRLEKDHLEVDLKVTDIEENSDARIIEITLLPLFGAGGLKDTGYALIPDGSGSLMKFNKTVKNLTQYVGYIYNRDLTSSSTDSSFVDLNETISLPVFGIEKNGAAFLSVITDGQGTAALKASVSRMSNSYNTIAPHIVVRDTQSRKNSTGDASNMSGVYYSNDTCGDLSINVYSLSDDDSDYVGMAKCYRNYLIEKQGLDEKVDESLTNAINIELFCAVKSPMHFAGIPYTGVKKLTSFEDVKGIIKDLKKRGIKNAVITLTGWADGGLESTLDTKISVDSKVGDLDEIKSLISFAEKNDVQLVFDTDVKTFYYGTSEVKKFKHTAFSLSNTPVTVFPFSKSLNRSVMTGDFYNLIHPKFMNEFTSVFVKNAIDAGIKNISFKSAGTDPYAAYNKDLIYTRDKSVEEIEKLFEKADSKIKDGFISTTVGNSFVLGSVDNIVDTPVYSSNLIISSVSVPFYQIVLRGHVNIAVTPLNLSSEVKELELKCAETGSSMFYQLMDSKSTSFENTNFSDYYACCYDDYSKIIEDTYKRLSNVYDAIGASEIEDHTIYGDVRFTKFSNGTSVYTNYSDDNAKFYYDKATGKYIVLYVGDVSILDKEDIKGEATKTITSLKNIDTNYTSVKPDIVKDEKTGKFTVTYTENGAVVLTLVYDMKTDECVITSSAGTSTVKPTKDISSRDYMVEGGKK